MIKRKGKYSVLRSALVIVLMIVGASMVLPKDTLAHFVGWVRCTSSPNDICFSGNVGIGTTAPQERLEVNGNIEIQSGNALKLTSNYASDSFKAHQIRMTDSQRGIEIESGADVTISIDKDSDQGDDIFAVTYGIEETPALRIEHNGNVGVGPSVPNSELEVSSGYLELDTSHGMPPRSDCNSPDEIGRMKVDNSRPFLYVCTAQGWVRK